MSDCENRVSRLRSACGLPDSVCDVLSRLLFLRLSLVRDLDDDALFPPLGERVEESRGSTDIFVA